MADEPRGRGPGRPPRLSGEAIVAAALEPGTGELTVRGLARRLGVSHSALYRWVGDRDGLLDLISDSLLERVLARFDDAPDADWRLWLVRFGLAVRREFGPVTDPEVLAQLPRPTGAYSHLLGRAEAVMLAQGLDGAQARSTFEVFLFTVWGWIAAEKLCAGTPGHDANFNAMLDALSRGLPAHGDG